jgi:hypothetical protein
VPARVEALIEERRKLERELTEARKKLAQGGGSSRSRRCGTGWIIRLPFHCDI